MPDHLALLYKRVRDAANMPGTSVAERIATLELIKWELLRDAQKQIDED